MEGGATTSTLTTILTAIGTFFTQFLDWVKELITFVTDNPILLIFVIIAIAGMVIGMVRRWIPGAGV